MKQALRFLIVLATGFFFVPDAGLSMPSSLTIELHRQGKFLEPDEIAKILEAGFQTLYPEKRYRIEVKSIQGFEKLELPSGNLSCDIALSEQARRGGNIYALLFFRTNGREVGKTRLSARVDIHTDVIVASRYLGKHHVLQEKDVEWASRILSLLPHDMLNDKREVFGKRTTITLNRGEVLRAGIVEDPPLLKRGDRVILLVENGSIKVTTLGEVREEGRRGDRIKLVNLSSRKEVSGRVLDAQTVRVDF